MTNTFTTMSTSDWGHLPAEIITAIFECFDYDDNYIEYQLVNKQWHFASLSVVYKSIVIHDTLTSKFDNWEKLQGLCSLLTNSTHNVGQYIKKITFWPSSNNLHLLGMLMKNCPNVEEFLASYSHEMCEYIISVQETNKNAIVWGNLQQINITTTPNNRYCFYRLMNVFRHSLTHVSLTPLPNMATDESAQGSELALYTFIEDFKNLEHLTIGHSIIESILDCERILQHCSTKLNELHLDLRWIIDDPAFIRPPLSETQVQTAYHHEDCPNLKTLNIVNYTPRMVRLEFMYLKHKFISLEKISCQISRFMEPLSEEVMDEIIGYFLGIPRFRLIVECRISLNIVQRFFNSYVKFVETKRLKISMEDFREDIRIQNYTSAALPVTSPHMEISYDQNLEDPRLIEELKSIMEHVGPHLHVLIYKNYGGNNASRCLMDTVLRVCPNLQELRVNGKYLKCCTQEQEPHNAIKTIKFGQYNKYESGFFECLAPRLPNLNCMTLKMEREIDQMEINAIQMPTTKFTKLTIMLKDAGPGWGSMYSENTVMKEEVVIRITTTKDMRISRIYHNISKDCRKSVNELKLVHEREDDRLDDYTVITSSTIKPRVTLHISCFSIESFTLDTGFNKYYI